jgi:hypothetical protein
MLLWLCRIPTMLCAAVLGIFVYRWSSQLYGTAGGLFSLFIFVFCPNIVAHARLATTDVYCCVLMFISLFAFKEYARRRTFAHLIFLAAAVGVAQLTKQTALLLLPIMLVLGAARAFGRPAAFRLYFKKKFLLHSVVFVLIVLFIINLGYFFDGTFSSFRDCRQWFATATLESVPPDLLAPKSAVATLLERIPLPVPRAYLEGLILGTYYNATGTGHGPIYLLGQLSQYGHWYYFVVAFLLKTPLPTLALLAAALWITIKSGQFSLRSDEAALLVSAAVLFVFFSFCNTAQLGIRYILPVYPFLYVLLGKIVSQNMTRAKTGIVAGVCVYLVVSFMSYAPHFISYFNEICWNRTQLCKYLADSNLDWGQNDNYLAEYLQLHNNEEIHVNPRQPTSGKIIVDVNDLVGVRGDASNFKWLRDNYQPVGNVAYSWLIYDVPAR